MKLSYSILNTLYLIVIVIYAITPISALAQDDSINGERPVLSSSATLTGTEAEGSRTIDFFTPSKELNRDRLYGVIAGEVAMYSGAIIGLEKMWYSDFPKSSFHFIDDSRQWMQMDKAGHLFSAYYLNNMEMEMYNWAGLNDKKTLWLGGSIGTLFLFSVEYFDGRSTWGASAGDLAANVAGRLISISQQMLWKEQRLLMKFSFHQTSMAKYRPGVLGSTLSENILKDYNGQSYWVSINVNSFLQNGSNFPKWLNFAMGYGAGGMLGGAVNPSEVDGVAVPEFDRYRKLLISLDIDLTKIPVKSHFGKMMFKMLNFVKIPFTALEISDANGVKLHPFYF